ncbi:MAG TPA: hypothetical protein VLS44_09450, partial [Nitrospira sp.]|nr:hypothetical protein [Nitrospira sp.]
MVISVAALAVVWGVVWANMPTMEEMQSSRVPVQAADAAFPSPVLDLTIPGVSAAEGKGSVPSVPEVVVNGAEGPTYETAASDRSAPIDHRTRQIVEMKCDAAVEPI